VKGGNPVSIAVGIDVLRSMLGLAVGPESAAFSEVTVEGGTSAPLSSVSEKVSAICSPGSIVPSPLFVPDSATVRPVTWKPGLNVGFSSGWRWPLRTASDPPVAGWQKMQLVIVQLRFPSSGLFFLRSPGMTPAGRYRAADLPRFIAHARSPSAGGGGAVIAVAFVARHDAPRARRCRRVLLW
jgi:hypothetical protein